MICTTKYVSELYQADLKSSVSYPSVSIVCDMTHLESVWSEAWIQQEPTHPQLIRPRSLQCPPPLARARPYMSAKLGQTPHLNPPESDSRQATSQVPAPDPSLATSEARCYL